MNETVRRNLQNRLRNVALLASIDPEIVSSTLRERSQQREVQFPSPLEIPANLDYGFLSPLSGSVLAKASAKAMSSKNPDALPERPERSSGEDRKEETNPYSPRPMARAKDVASPRIAMGGGSSYVWTESNPMNLWDSTCPTLLDGLLPLLLAEHPKRKGVPTFAGCVWSSALPSESRIFIFKGCENTATIESHDWTDAEREHIRWLFSMMRDMCRLNLRWSRFKVDTRARGLMRNFVFGNVLYLFHRFLWLLGKAWRVAMPLVIGFLDSNPDVKLFLPEEALESLAALSHEASAPNDLNAPPVGYTASHRLGDNLESPKPAPSPPSAPAELSVNLSIADLLAHDPVTPPPQPATPTVQPATPEDEFFSASSLRSPVSASPIVADSQPIRRGSGIHKSLLTPLVLPPKVEVSDSEGKTVTLKSFAEERDKDLPMLPPSVILSSLAELRQRIHVIISRPDGTKVYRADDHDLPSFTKQTPTEADDPMDCTPSDGDPHATEDPATGLNDLRAQTAAFSKDSVPQDIPCVADTHPFLGEAAESMMSLSIYFERLLDQVNNSSKNSRQNLRLRRGNASPLSPFARGLSSPLSPMNSPFASPRSPSLRPTKAQADADKANFASAVLSDAVRSEFGKTWYWNLPVDERNKVLRVVYKLASVAASITSLLRACCDPEYRDRIAAAEPDHVVLLDSKDIALLKSPYQDFNFGSKAAKEDPSKRPPRHIIQLLEAGLGLDKTMAAELTEEWLKTQETTERLDLVETLLDKNIDATESPVSHAIDRAHALHPAMMAYTAYAAGYIPVPANGKIRLSMTKLPCHPCFKLFYQHNVQLRNFFPLLRLSKTGTSAVVSPRKKSPSRARPPQPPVDPRAPTSASEVVFALSGTSAKAYAGWTLPFPWTPRGALLLSDRLNWNRHAPATPECLDAERETLESSSSKLAQVVENLGDELESACRKALSNHDIRGLRSFSSGLGISLLSGAPRSKSGDFGRLTTTPSESESIKAVSTLEVNIDTSDWLK
ncbi:hypothetical protein HDU96_004351 [Phlyctochytrium bullatum]|nr:hypothetical protein HDU96_004351 [Phlyctochytrium bullatum]